jgi:peptide/nickel transport system substrate-binding protein
MKLRDLKKLGDHIVQVPLLAPNGRLQDAFVTLNSTFVVQDGATDFTKPVGTGPFKLQSFTPGQTTVFTRNPDYWDDGKPYLDGQTMTDIADDNARLNALQSGQVDICTPLAFTLATSNQSNSAIKLLTAVGGPGQYIYMRVDTPPFNDVRVRQAMKLIADRPQLIATAFSGHGRVANDMPGPGLPDYDTSLPQRVQDIEQAKLLLKSAGRSDLRVTLQTAPVAEGIVEAATLYAQQAAKAGVTVNVKQDLPSSYFSPKLLYLKMPLAQDTWPTGSLSYIYETILRSTSGANETHWHNAESDKLLTQAEGAVNPAQRQALWNKVQALQYNEGGNIIWASRLSVDALAPHVQGVNTKGWLYGLGDRNVWDWWVSA